MGSKEMLSEIAAKSSAENYVPIPEGYKPGKTKYIIVTGSVISGIGKGLFTSSLGKLLVDRGAKVTPVKLEAYFNVDAGTMNPYRHGEVFVLDDGTECDMDLGSYERFLDKNLTKDSFVTSGRIYSTIIEKERKGLYLGRDVQFIPHVTGEAKMVIRNLAMKTDADIVLVEIGGTVGDYENVLAIEAMRELRYEEGSENVCFINLTYILDPPSLGEQKSKAAQLGLKTLMSMGIQPSMVILRSDKPVSKKIREKVSINANVPLDRVIGAHNINGIYKLPLFLKDLNVDGEILECLGVEKKFRQDGDKVRKWTEANTVEKAKKKITVGITGKYTGLSDAYISILKALEHCEGILKTEIEVRWIETTKIENGREKVSECLKGVDGIIVPGGFGARGVEGKIACIKYARENNIPYLGLCYGFQMAVIEFARNAMGLKGANTTEVDEKAKDPVICILPEQEEIEGLGGTMRLGGYDVVVGKGTIAHRLYGKEKIRERFRHRFNVNTKYIDDIEKAGMSFSGRAPQKRIMQILELPKHKFFVGTQFHPEFTSRPLKPNPLFRGFVEACLK